MTTGITGAELLSLAERVESADGPDKALNDDIARALGWTQHSDEDDPVFVGETRLWWAEPGQEYSTCSWPPAYTASIDAALTLVPHSHEWMVNWCGNSCADVTELPDGHNNRASAATPALALTAACLRARAALAEQS